MKVIVKYPAENTNAELFERTTSLFIQKNPGCGIEKRQSSSRGILPFKKKTNFDSFKITDFNAIKIRQWLEELANKDINIESIVFTPEERHKNHTETSNQPNENTIQILNDIKRKVLDSQKTEAKLQDMNPSSPVSNQKITESGSPPKITPSEVEKSGNRTSAPVENAAVKTSHPPPIGVNSAGVKPPPPPPPPPLKAENKGVELSKEDNITEVIVPPREITPSEIGKTGNKITDSVQQNVVKQPPPPPPPPPPLKAKNEGVELSKEDNITEVIVPPREIIPSEIGKTGNKITDSVQQNVVKQPPPPPPKITPSEVEKSGNRTSAPVENAEVKQTTSLSSTSIIFSEKNSNISSTGNILNKLNSSENPIRDSAPENIETRPSLETNKTNSSFDLACLESIGTYLQHLKNPKKQLIEKFYNIIENKIKMLQSQFPSIDFNDLEGSLYLAVEDHIIDGFDSIEDNDFEQTLEGLEQDFISMIENQFNSIIDENKLPNEFRKGNFLYNCYYLEAKKLNFLICVSTLGLGLLFSIINSYLTGNEMLYETQNFKKYKKYKEYKEFKESLSANIQELTNISKDLNADIRDKAQELTKKSHIPR